MPRHDHSHPNHAADKREHNASLFALSALQRLLIILPLLLILWLAVGWALGEAG